MKIEVKIILEDGSSNRAQGNCFEDLIKNLLHIQQYKVKSNIRFTGMEIDLMAEHNYKKENLYVECKAKEKVSSTELRNFCFNVHHRNADSGYFFRTKDLEYDAGGLLDEIRKDERYKNLHFFEPYQMVSMLIDAKMIYEPTERLRNYTISKKILAVTYFGDYFIYLINDSLIYPVRYLIVDARDNKNEVSDVAREKLPKSIDEIQKLSYEKLNDYEIPLQSKSNYIESISEVQGSEKWYDYLPASSKKRHFVGRETIRGNILEYFKEVAQDKTKKRIFYLNGKSGWGKSSLILEIKERCENKHYKNKFFCLAIDTRSAISDNFVSLAFNKIIKQAFQNKFLQKDLFNDEIEFTSSTDLLSSDSIKNLINLLNSENKYLVLIFDQFEDVFRKSDLFKSFYKFLSDVSDVKPNIIVGFSWKSEFFIPNDDPAYYLWQQAKEQSAEFVVGEFGEKEIDGIIKQLEQSVGKLDTDIKRRIKESSQGLPWLTKKLCIHIREQVEGGLKKDKLVEFNLNIKELFEKDKERVSPDELKALQLIAQKAYEGDFFEVSEVGESVMSTTIESLLHKRLIIKSGTNYNIYWDIFRDYLIKNEIPIIGESYLLRQGVNLCLEVFLLFKSGVSETLDSLHLRHEKKIGSLHLENILLELRNFGLVEKNDDYYTLSKTNVPVTQAGFTAYATNKFKNYTPYLELKKKNLDNITKEDLKDVLKSIFKQDYQDKTWGVYSLTLLNWFLMSDIDIKSKILEPRKGRGGNIIKRDIPLPKSSVREIIKCVKTFNTGDDIQRKNYWELLQLDFIDTTLQLTIKGKEFLLLSEEKKVVALKESALVFPKMKQVKNIVDRNPKIKTRELLEQLPEDFFMGKALSSKLIYATYVLSWLR